MTSTSTSDLSTTALPPTLPPGRRRGRRPRGRRAGTAAGVLLLLCAAVVGPAAGAAAALATAAGTARLPVLLGVGLLVHLLVSWGLARGGGRLIGLQHRARWRVAGWTAATTACLLAGVTVLTVLTPIASPSAGLLAPQGPGRAWNLTTGSTVVYDHLPAVGPTRPTPVVLLHGGPGTPGSGTGGATGTALSAAGFDVYAYDQVGAGRSERLADPTEYTVARNVADLDAVREQVGAEQVVLVGTSWGATLAAAYTAEHPERVARVVFVSPGELWAPAWAGRDRGELWDRVPADRRRRADEVTAGPRATAWSLLMLIDPRAAHELIGDAEVDAVFNDLLLLAGSGGTCHPEREVARTGGRPGFYANQVLAEDELLRPDPRPALRRTSTPALVLRGECDYISRGVAREYVDTLPGARLVDVPGAGHLLRSEQPRAYQDAVVGFLTS